MDYGLPEDVPSYADPEPAPSQFFKRYDLAALARTGVPEPQFLCEGLLYTGGLHSVAGPPDCGKSTLMCWAAMEVLASGGEFVLMDEESGPAQYTEKLLALGARADQLERLHYFPFPGVNWSTLEVAAFIRMVTLINPRVIAWDSSAAFMARAGMSEDDAGDVTRFWSQVLTPCARDVGAAVLIADHDAKNAGPSRYSRGSSAKLAATDVQYKMEIISPFSRIARGDVKLNVTKDRRGYLHRFNTITFVPRNGGERLDVQVAQTGTPAGQDTPLGKEVLGTLTHEGQSAAQITTKINLASRGSHHKDAVKKELYKLQATGRAESMSLGMGRETLWCLMPAQGTLSVVP